VNYQKFNTILMRVIAVLLMLVLLSTAAVTGRFARYISSSSGSDSARVAKFNVDYTLAPVEGKNGEYTLRVQNNSEVAVKYSVSIVFEETLLADSLEATLGTKTVQLSADNKTISFGEIEQLAPDANGTPYTLTITLKNPQLITGTDEITGLSATKTLNFTVAVTATQID